MSRGDMTSVMSSLEKDFHNALDRLRQGEPQNKELMALHKKGKLRINKSTIALEAGHSRTTYKNHPVINQYVESQLSKKAASESITAQDVNKALRAEIKQLTMDKARLATQMADLANYTRQLESELKKANQKLKRKSSSNDPMKVVGRSTAGSGEAVSLELEE